MSDLNCRCVVSPSRTLTRTLEALRSGIASNTSRISDLETSYLSLNAAITTLNGTFRVAQSEDQLRDYLEEGGLIFTDGEIEGTEGTFEVTEEGTKVIGLPGSSIIVPTAAGSATDVLRVKAPNVWLFSLNLSTGFALDGSDSDAVFDIGVRLDPAIDFDISDLIIWDCDIHHVGTGIWKAGSTDSEWAERIKILHNHIHAFSQWGVAMSYRFRGLLVGDNHVQGRDTGQTHDVEGNCIWLAEHMDHTSVVRNRCSQSDRNGIEFYANTANLGSNIKGQILFNRIEDVSSIGISAFGTDSVLVEGNQVSGTKVIGIELYNSVSTLGETMIRNNHVKNIGPVVGNVDPTVGISVDQVTKASIVGNVIENIVSDTGVDSCGLQIIHSGTNIKVEGNTFRDAGTRMLRINGDGVDEYTAIIFGHNTFFYSSDYTTTYPSPTFSYWPAIEANNVSAIVAKNNTVFYPSAAPSLGLMQILNSGTAYVGDEFEAPVSPSTGGSHLRGSNIRVPY